MLVYLPQNFHCFVLSFFWVYAVCYVQSETPPPLYKLLLFPFSFLFPSLSFSTANHNHKRTINIRLATDQRGTRVV